MREEKDAVHTWKSSLPCLCLCLCLCLVHDKWGR